jgi:predicted nuclease of restriction endonuclease-like RecB superfamily
MGFSLQHINFKRKSRGSKPQIFPYFLSQKEQLKIQQTKNYITNILPGKKMGNIDSEELESIWSNYKISRAMNRLANHHFIRKTIPRFDAGLPKKTITQLLSQGIDDPSTLRLALYQYLENNYNGFIEPNDRKRILGEFGKTFGLNPTQMESLLSLDQEENSVIILHRDPTPTEIIELFNFHVLDTIFRQGYKLTFSVDDQVTGTLVKTFCMLAKRKGIVYDITQESENRFHFTIYGPFEIFGRLTKYGFRLYERKYLLQLTSQDFPPVAFFEQYKGILQESNPAYDSSVEAQFVRRFSKNTRGWTLENEPEPLLFDGNVMIPDFVATRGEKRVFIEVIGYWRPEYKKRKRKKLEQLDEHGIQVLLLIDKKFESDFPRTFSSHPIVFYSKKTSFNLTNLLAILDQMTGRKHSLESIKANVDETFPFVLEKLGNSGFVTIGALKELLDCYDEEEILPLVSRLIEQNPRVNFIPKLGLLSQTLVARMTKTLKTQVKNQEISLDTITDPLSQELPNFDVITFIEWTKSYEINWKSLQTPTIRRKHKPGRKDRAPNVNRQ